MNAYGQDDRSKQQIFMRNSRKHQNAYDNSALLAVVKLDFGQGETKTLHVHQTDDVVELAEQFCIDNELEEDCVEHMVQYITQQIKLAQKNCQAGDSANLMNNYQTKNYLASENHYKNKSIDSVQNSSEKEEEEEEELQSETTSSSSSSQHKLFHFQSKEKIENYQRRTSAHVVQNNKPIVSAKYKQAVQIGEEKYISQQSQQEIQQKETRNTQPNHEYPAYQAPSESICQVTYEKWSKLISERKIIEQQRQRIVSEYSTTTAASPSYPPSSSRNLLHHQNAQTKTEEQLLILDKIRSENLLPPCIGSNRAQIKKSMIIGNVIDEPVNHPLNARKSIQKSNMLIAHGSASQLPQGKKEIAQNVPILDLQQSRRESVQQNEIQGFSQVTSQRALTSRNLTPKQRYGICSPRANRDLSNNSKKISNLSQIEKNTFHQPKEGDQAMVSSKRLSTTPEKKVFVKDLKTASRSPSPMSQKQNASNFQRDGKHQKTHQVQSQQHGQTDFMSRSQGKRENQQTANKSDTNNSHKIQSNRAEIMNKTSTGNPHFSTSVSSLLSHKNANIQQNEQNINIIESHSQLQNPLTMMTPQPALENKLLQPHPKLHQTQKAVEQRAILAGNLKNQSRDSRNQEEQNFRLFLQDNIFTKMDVNKDGWISVSDVAIEQLDTAELEILQEFLFHIADNPERTYTFADFYEYIGQHEQAYNALRELFRKKYCNIQTNSQREILQSSSVQSTNLNCNNLKNNVQNQQILQTDFSEFSFAEDNPLHHHHHLPQTNQNNQVYLQNQSNDAAFEHYLHNQDYQQFQSIQTPPNDNPYQQQLLQQQHYQSQQHPFQSQGYCHKEPSFGIESSLIDTKLNQLSQQPPSFVSGRYKSLVKKQSNHPGHPLS